MAAKQKQTTTKQKKPASSATKKSSKSQAKPKPVTQPELSSRKLKAKPKRYDSFRLSRRIKHPQQLASAWRIFKQSLASLSLQKRPLLGIFLVFFLLSIVLVRGFAGSEAQELQDVFGELFDDRAGQVIGSVVLVGFLATDVTTAPTEVAGLYQTILFTIVSLATIYVVRAVRSGSETLPKTKEAFYKGMYPLIPFVLVFFVIGLQLLPFALGAWLFGTVTAAGLAVHGVEIALWGIVFFLLSLLSLYMVTSSVFALYIVTLPDMTPLQALRSARELVRYRRFTVLRKILFLPFILILIALFLLTPIVLFITPVAAFFVLAFTVATTMYTHVYMYQLYRELL